MATVLISFLGLGAPDKDENGKPTGKYFYNQTNYRFNQDATTDIKTSYVVRAIAERYTIDEPQRDKTIKQHRVTEVILLATKEAENGHFHTVLDEFETAGLPTPSFVRVPSGANSEEQWQQFNTLLECIPSSSEDKVIFDITHGFRSQPFFAAAVINYVRSTRSEHEIPDMHVLYGEYNQEEKISNIWDMTTFVSLLDWSNALQGFIKTGHGDALAKLARQENAVIQKSIKENRPKNLAKLAESLKAFSENIATVRVPNIITGADNIRGSARNILLRIDESQAEVDTYFKPLQPVLNSLKARLSSLPADSLFSESGHKAMFELAKLYVEYERYPEAAAVLREGWVSLYADKSLDDEALLEKTQRHETEQHWQREEGSQSKERIADALSAVRNDIQHAGFRTTKERKPADSLMRDLTRLIEQFEAKAIELNQQ